LASFGRKVGLQGIWEGLATRRVQPLLPEFGTPGAAAKGINRSLIRLVSTLGLIPASPRDGRLSKQHGVTVPGASGVAVIVTSTYGHNSIVVVPGANGKLGPEQLARHTPLLHSA
jgi:hypothetical protein